MQISKQNQQEIPYSLVDRSDERRDRQGEANRLISAAFMLRTRRKQRITLAT